MKKIFKDWRTFLNAHKNNPNVASLLSEQLSPEVFESLQQALDGPAFSRGSAAFKSAERALLRLVHEDRFVALSDPAKRKEVIKLISDNIRFLKNNINNSNLQQLFKGFVHNVGGRATTSASNASTNFARALELIDDAIVNGVDLDPKDKEFLKKAHQILKGYGGHLDGTNPIAGLRPAAPRPRATSGRSGARSSAAARSTDIGRSSSVASADSARARSAQAPNWERVGQRASPEEYARAAANNRAAASAAANAAELGDDGARAAAGAVDDVVKAASTASPITKSGLKPNTMASRYKSMSKGVIKGLAGYGIKGAKGGLKIVGGAFVIGGGLLRYLAWPLTIFDPFAAEAHAATLPTKQSQIKNALANKYNWVYGFFNSIGDNYMYRHFEACFSVAYVTDYDVPGSTITSNGPIIVALVDDETGWSKLQKKYPKTYNILVHVVEEINRNHEEDLRRKKAAEKIKADQERIYRKYPDVSPGAKLINMRMTGLQESNKKKKP